LELLVCLEFHVGDLKAVEPLVGTGMGLYVTE
jgi:hypothetical protein